MFDVTINEKAFRFNGFYAPSDSRERGDFSVSQFFSDFVKVVVIAGEWNVVLDLDLYWAGT